MYGSLLDTQPLPIPSDIEQSQGVSSKDDDIFEHDPIEAPSDSEEEQAAPVDEADPVNGPNGHVLSKEDNGGISLFEVSPMDIVSGTDQEANDQERASSVEAVEAVETPIYTDVVSLNLQAAQSETEDRVEVVDQGPEDSQTARTDTAQNVQGQGKQQFVMVSADESENESKPSGRESGRDSVSTATSNRKHPQIVILEDPKLKALSVELVTGSKGEFVKFVKKILNSKLKDKIWLKCDSKGTGVIDEEKFMFFWILPVTLFKVAQFQRKNKTKEKHQPDAEQLRRDIQHLATVCVCWCDGVVIHIFWCIHSIPFPLHWICSVVWCGNSGSSDSMAPCKRMEGIPFC